MYCSRCGNQKEGKHSYFCIDCRNKTYFQKNSKKCVICGNRYLSNGGKKACSNKCNILSGIIVNENGCWEWKRSKEKSGHARVRDYETGERIGIHRISYKIFKGEIPKGYFVCHDCPNGDNPGCCNPEHLFLGTQKENMRDAKKKGTMTHGLKPGEKHYNCKITEEIVRNIRKEYLEGITRKQLAKKYETPLQNIHKIIQRKSWKYLE